MQSQSKQVEQGAGIELNWEDETTLCTTTHRRRTRSVAPEPEVEQRFYGTAGADAADEQLKVDEIGRRVGCQGQAVRQAIHAFHREGLDCLQPKAKGNPRDRRALDDTAREQLRNLIRRCPRELGYATSLWTLDLLAQACFEQGITVTQVTGETIRATLVALGINWRRVKQHIHSPDHTIRSKKAARLAETAGTAARRLAAGGGR